MNVRARIVVEGTVQGVGFRDFVAELAGTRGLDGIVRNLPNKKVEIICEGEKSKIEKLAEIINVRQYPVFVKDLKVEYSKATGEFVGFEIEWEADTNAAIMERLGLASHYLRDLGGKLDAGFEKLGDKVDAGREENTKGLSALGEKIDAGFSDLGDKVDNVDRGIQTVVAEIKVVGEKVDGVAASVQTVGNKVDAVAEGVKAVGGNVDSLTEVTVSSFDRMNTKYDKISKAMFDIVEQLREDRKEARVEMKELIKAVLASRK